MSARFRRCLGVAVVAVGYAAALHLGPATAEPAPAIEPPPALTLPPELDPFYKPPAEQVAAAAPGQILRARAINPAFMSIVALNVDAWQLLYRTNDSHGNAIATVTTVLKPRGAAPAEGRKLLSYQIAEDSAAQYCAQSYVVQFGSLPIDYVNAAELLIPLAAGVGQGWTVSIPDYEGPNSAYGAARLGAQATLDGIRAVENFAPAQLDGPKTPAALWGYSGGTIPSSFAAEIAQDYAPELNIVGIASGGVAPADYEAIVRHNNGGVYAGLISATFAGISTEYPDMEKALRDNVNGFGQFILGTKRVLCHPQGSIVFPGFNYLGTSTGPDLLSLPAVRAAIADNTLGQRIPTMPVYLYQAQFDEIIPHAGVDRVVQQYCDAGAPSVTYRRELLAEHISGLVTHLPSAFHWVRDRLDGVPISGCRIESPVSTIPEPEFGRALSEILPPMAQALVGQAIGSR
ncbi:lipase family protein [Nocardia transvalensis]|uniref:lipase family protein n=1 Tax=Nocardia transvalensis TaxID=37333 RepID=UPI00189454AC|nr:lipase family protein [Nocardia transvalensis]MBF6333132.1 lipase [Nocardia transvalensis]